jgi:hypothetical protein
VFNIHFEPYQNPKEYEANIQKNNAAIPSAEKRRNFILLAVAYYKHF